MKILINKLKDGTDTSEVIFSDEKLFTVATDKMIAFLQNQQETFLIALGGFSDVKSLLLTWFGTISKTWKSPLVFVHQGAKVNTNSYTELILTLFFKNRPFKFQQDGTPSHTSNKTQKWCQDNFPRFWSKELWLNQT